jgi:Tfp pilus assembly PilM family ATPase
MARKRIAHVRPSEFPHVAPRVLSEVLAGRGAGAEAVLGVTGRDVNLQVRVFPSSKLTRYGQMIRNEITGLRQEQPDLYIDYATLRTPDAYFPKYLAIIGMGKNSYVDERMAIANAAGVGSSDVVPTPFALYAAYAASYPGEGGVVMLLNIGADNTDMVLVRGGRLIFVRNISQGARLFDEQIRAAGIKIEGEAEFYKIKFGGLGSEGEDPRSEEVRPAMRQAAWQLVGMLKSSLTYAKNQLDEPDLAVDRVYVSGGGAKISGLAGYLKSALGAPVEPLDPFRNMDTAFVRQSGEEEAVAVPSDMAIVTGLALLGLNGGKRTAVSLLPDRIRDRRKARRTVPFLVAAGVLFAVTLVWLSISLHARLAEERAKAAAFSSEIAGARSKVEELNKLEAEYRKEYAKLDTLQTLNSTGKGILGVYHRLRLLHREGLLIKKIEVSEPQTVRRAIANVPEKGHVVGVVTGETEDSYLLAGTGQVPRSAAYAWEVTIPRMAIYGEVDENIKGGANETLMDMSRKLADPSNRVTCGPPWQGPSEERPGWRVFRIPVNFE